ncbi:unnamed protein product [Discula destructiva]
MVRLRSKLHLSRQGRKLSSSHANFPDECNAATTAQPAGSTSATEPAGLAPSSLSSPSLDLLPEELLIRVACFCEFGDFLRLQRASRTLHRIFENLSVIEQILLGLMDPFSTNGTPRRDALLERIKAQLDDESRDQEFRRDVFLCLAVTIPQKQRARVKGELETLLARARIKYSCRDPDLGEALQDLHDDFNVAVELERSIGVISALLVMGYWDVCDLAIGRQLITLNHWSVKSNLWPERRLFKNKEISLQLAMSMVLGLIDPFKWSEVPSALPEYPSLAQRVTADYRGADSTSSSQSFLLSWEGLQTRSLQLAGLIACILRTGGLEDVPRSDLLSLHDGASQPILDDWTVLSSASSFHPRTKIPLLENFSNSGVRAQPNAWQEWYTSRVRDLVQTIEDEEWYGYYVYTLEDSDSFGPSGARDPAMENIHFKLGSAPPLSSAQSQVSTATSSTATGQPPKLPLEARGGKDGVTVKFDFAGTIRPTTGIVSLRKSYRGAHYWDYEGVMTPLGIVGEWGREGTGYYGYFWLWKRSWMGGNVVQRTHAYA